MPKPITAYRDLFDANFGRYTEISEAAIEFLQEHFQVFEFKAHDFLVKAGEVERYLYFVAQGVQAIYFSNQKGEKVVLGFSFSGSISGVYDSFLNVKPSQVFLEALTPSVLIGIRKEKYDLLFDHFPEFKDWRMRFFEGILLGRLAREVELTSQSAQQRFDAFTKRCPSELLTIPQKYLASYLNMKPETFSRLRARRM